LRTNVRVPGYRTAGKSGRRSERSEGDRREGGCDGTDERKFIALQSNHSCALDWLRQKNKTLHCAGRQNGVTEKTRSCERILESAFGKLYDLAEMPTIRIPAAPNSRLKQVIRDPGPERCKTYDQQRKSGVYVGRLARRMIPVQFSGHHLHTPS
jgi:hypothetical protein